MATCRICGRPHNRYVTDGDARSYMLRCLDCVAKVNPARAERDRRVIEQRAEAERQMRERDRRERVPSRCRWTLDLVDMAEAQEVSA